MKKLVLALAALILLVCLGACARNAQAVTTTIGQCTLTPSAPAFATSSVSSTLDCQNATSLQVKVCPWYRQSPTDSWQQATCTTTTKQWDGTLTDTAPVTLTSGDQYSSWTWAWAWKNGTGSTTGPTATYTPQSTPTVNASPSPYQSACSGSCYTVQLTWSGVTVASQTGYYIFQNSSQIADVTASPDIVTTLSCGTTYTFGVEAHDGASPANVSAMYSTTYTTPACAGTSSQTFGTTTVGSSSAGLAADYKRAISYTPTASGPVPSLSVYLGPSGTTGSQSVRGLLYADSSGTPGALLATSDELTMSNTSTLGWHTLTFPTSPTVTSGTPYWIGIISGATASIANFYYTTAGSNVRQTNANTYTSGPSNPFSSSGTLFPDAEQMSLYGTVAASGSPTNTAAPSVTDTTQAGSYTVGDKLSTTSGTWTGSPTYTYRWQYCNSSNLCSNKSGATGSTYTLTSADVGYTFRSVVTAANSTGTVSTASAVTGTVGGGSTPPLWQGTSLSSFGYQSFCSGDFFFTSDPLGSGESVLETNVPDTCAPYSGSLPRGDVWATGNGFSRAYMAANAEYDVSDSFYFPSTAINTINNNQVADSGSSFILMDEMYGSPYGGSPATPNTGIMYYNGANRFESSFGRASTDLVQWHSPSAINAGWHSVIYDVYLSTTGSSSSSPPCSSGSGWVKFWFDGVQQTLSNGSTTYCYATLQSGNNWDGSGEMWNIASYRAGTSGSFNIPSLLFYHGEAKIGTSYNSVIPDKGTTGP